MSKILWGRCYYVHFTDEESETPRYPETWSRHRMDDQGQVMSLQDWGSLLLLPASWHLQPFSFISTPIPHLPSEKYILNLLACYPMALQPKHLYHGSYPIFSLPCSAPQRWLQGIMGLQKSRWQEDVCIDWLPDIHLNVQYHIVVHLPAYQERADMNAGTFLLSRGESGARSNMRKGPLLLNWSNTSLGKGMKLFMVTVLTLKSRTLD